MYPILRSCVAGMVLAVLSLTGRPVLTAAEPPVVPVRDATLDLPAEVTPAGSLSTGGITGDIPLRVTWCDGAPGPRPVIIWSHGLGGSNQGYSYLAEAWARAGFVVIRPTHRGSDGPSLRGKVVPLLSGTIERDQVISLGGSARRLGDVTQVVARLDTVAAAMPGFGGTLDPAHLGLGGHSFGAWTALVGSARMAQPKLRDPATLPTFQAVLACSPPGPGWNLVAGPSTAPALVMTGTLDTVPKALDPKGQGQDWQRRVETFELLSGGDRCLTVLTGARHSAFSGGQGAKLKREPGPESWMVEAITTLSTDFWKAHLQGDAAAAARLKTAAPYPHWQTTMTWTVKSGE